MNTETMDYYMANTLHYDAWPICDLHFRAPPVYGLETVDNELILECNHHALLENDPQRFCLDDAITESSRLGIDWVIRWVGHNVDCTILPSQSLLAEAYNAVSQCMSVRRPIGIKAPTIIDYVHGFLG